MNAQTIIESGRAVLGIEFGSTRIKAVLVDEENKPIAQGSHTWENQLIDGLWTYSIQAMGKACKTAMPRCAKMSKSNMA